jgi:ribosomal protein L37E
MLLLPFSMVHQTTVSFDLLGIIAVSALAVLIFGLLTVGLVLVVRDTIRQRGKWGINTKPGVCTQCGTPAPLVRVPANRKQALWGGWTCAECGFELDKWGRPVEGQNQPAKWKVLGTVEEVGQRRPRSRPRDERICDVNDQTQRGDAP